MAGRRAQQSDDAELAFHRREWRWQRLGWAAMALFVAAAIAGLFGSGPLSKAHSGDATHGTVDYERFARYGADTSVRICAAKSAGEPAEFRVSIPRDYLEAFEVKSIVPEPRSTEGSPHRVEFVFDISAERSCVLLRLQPTQVGRARGPFTLDAGNEVAVQQFVYP